MTPSYERRFSVHNGFVVKTTGDGIHAVFASAADGARAALQAQRDLDQRRMWATIAPDQVARAHGSPHR